MPTQPPHRPDTRDDDSTSRSLVVGLREGSDDAWQRLVTLYTPLVHHWLLRLEIPRDDVPDVVQEVFHAVSRNLDRFRRDRPGDTFRGWLRVITRNKAIDLYRRRGDELRGAGGTDALGRLANAPDRPLPEDAPTDPHSSELYGRALDLIRSEFRESTWRAFWRVVVDECSPAEVAEELDTTPGAVRVAKCRVLQRLRLELGDGRE